MVLELDAWSRLLYTPEVACSGPIEMIPATSAWLTACANSLTQRWSTCIAPMFCIHVDAVLGIPMFWRNSTGRTRRQWRCPNPHHPGVKSQPVRVIPRHDSREEAYPEIDRLVFSRVRPAATSSRVIWQHGWPGHMQSGPRQLERVALFTVVTCRERRRLRRRMLIPAREKKRSQRLRKSPWGRRHVSRFEILAWS